MTEPKNDWRMQNFTHLAKDWISPWTGQFVPKGSQITISSIIKLTSKKHLTIAIPNATALCLNASMRSWLEATEIRRYSGIDKTLKTEVTFPNHALSYDYIERVMESVVMAFMALEAFANEAIPDDFKYHTNKKSTVILEVMGKNEIERYLSLDEKLSKVLPQALSIKSPKGSRCWNGFSNLNKIRDRIIHMKKSDRKSSGPEIPTLWAALFKIEPPYSNAKSVIDYYVKAVNLQYWWHNEFPKT